MKKFYSLFCLVCLSALAIISLPLSAEANPVPWQLGFQEAATPVMEYIHNFNFLVLGIMALVVIFVALLLGYVLIRFSKKNNPIPRPGVTKLWLEIAWTLIPLIIVVLITIPSLKILKHEEYVPESNFTIKVVAHQWYWSYEYPDYGNISFDSNIKYDLAPHEPRLLTVDNQLILPINTNIRVQVTSADVIHSFSVPAFGIKKDAIPGRLNETWFNIKKAGIYYGQCYELCGVLHGFMPIVVRAVPQEEFELWIEETKNKV